MTTHGATPALDRPVSTGWPTQAIRTLARAIGLGTPNPKPNRTPKENISMNIQSDIQADNGVNVEALLGAREAITAMPPAGQFTWRAACDWQSGTHSRSTVGGFFGLGEEQPRNASFTIDADHPEQFAASNAGATPVEIVLCALASCLAAGVASVAQNRGIQLHKVTAHVEGDMDLAGILGIDADVRNGFNDIRVRFEIDADASDEEIAAVVAQSQKRSAVFDIIANPSNVSVSVA